MNNGHHWLLMLLLVLWHSITTTTTTTTITATTTITTATTGHLSRLSTLATSQTTPHQISNVEGVHKFVEIADEESTVSGTRECGWLENIRGDDNQTRGPTTTSSEKLSNCSTSTLNLSSAGISDSSQNSSVGDSDLYRCPPDTTSANLSCQPTTPSFNTTPVVGEINEWEKGMLNYQQFSLIMKYMRTCTPIPAIISVACGIISAIVFSHKKLRNSTTFLVVAFNLAETAKAVVFVINRVWKSSVHGHVLTWWSGYTQFFVYFVTFVPDACGRAGLTLNSIITVDRFIVLAFPLKTMNRKPIRHPKIIITIVVFAMLLWQLPMPLIIHFSDVRHKAKAHFTEDQIVGLIAITIPQGMAVYSYLNIVGTALFRYVPLLVSIIFNILTMIRLYLHEKYRRKQLSCTALTKSQKLTRQTNITIVVSSLIFAILVTANPLLRIIGLLDPILGDAKREMLVYNLLQEVTLLVDNLSPMVNLITYLRMSSVFLECFWLRFAAVSSRLFSNTSDLTLSDSVTHTSRSQKEENRDGEMS